MENSAVRQAVLSALQELVRLPKTELLDEVCLADLGLDSLLRVELTVTLDELDVPLNEMDVASIVTVGDLLNIVDTKRLSAIQARRSDGVTR
jgi:acyl carrier protein